MVKSTALTVFVILFVFVTVVGFVAAKWRRGDLNLLDEWGLAGRRFGTVVTWFLLGGDLYTAYTFVAVPALVYSAGAVGLFALPYTIITYPIVFIIMPRLWQVCHKHGYVTPADFVRGRFDSHGLALAVAFTGILATMPYIALQLVGIEVVLAAMGITGDWPLVIAFLVLAAYTYFSGLRAPALIALVKDALIYITVIVAIIAIPMYLSTHLGGSGSWGDGITRMFGFVKKPPATVHGAKPSLLLSTSTKTIGGIRTSYLAFSTLALGSAMALFMYPHSITGTLAASSSRVIKRNTALLPAYSLLLGIIALFGFMAFAAHVPTNPKFGGQWAVPALVPASIMSIAAANLFTRNIYKEYIRPNATPQEESSTAKLVSLVVKAGALGFVLTLPIQDAINFQLLGGVWILQTFPAIVFGLFTRWFHRWALLIGWAVGMIVGTYMAYLQATPKVTAHFASSVYPLHLFGHVLGGYAALYAFILNIIIAAVLTFVFNALHVEKGKDATVDADYHEAPIAVAAM